MSRILSAVALALLLAACAGGSAEAKAPKTSVVTFTEDDHTLGTVDGRVWHGTIDGRECIVVGWRYPSVTCAWGAR